jgi:hypothetical protein
VSDSGRREPAPFAYGVVLVALLILTGLIGIAPGYLLSVGIQAAGAALGWWIGDPTTNDGEEIWATAFGALICATLIAAGVASALALRTPFGVRTRVPAITSFALLVALAVFLWGSLFIVGTD